VKALLRGIGSAAFWIGATAITGMVLMGFHVIHIGSTIDFTASGDYIVLPMWALVMFPIAIGLFFGGMAWNDYLEDEQKLRAKELAAHKEPSRG
jgi:hypothetical protein